MSDSPAEKKGEENVSKPPMVPVSRINEVTAKYKEAKAQAEAAVAELESLKSELEKQKQSTVDIESVVKERISKEVAPLKEAARIGEIGLSLGLNGEQARAVAALQDKYGGLGLEQALLLARVEHGDLFPQAPTYPRTLPPSGSSPARQAPEKDTFASDLSNAKTREDKQVAYHKEFQRRVLLSKERGPH